MVTPSSQHQTNNSMATHRRLVRCEAGSLMSEFYRTSLMFCDLQLIELSVLAEFFCRTGIFLFILSGAGSNVRPTHAIEDHTTKPPQQVIPPPSPSLCFLSFPLEWGMCSSFARCRVLSRGKCAVSGRTSAAQMIRRTQAAGEEGWGV